MRKIIIACLVLLSISCKKGNEGSNTLPGNPKNKFEADVSVAGNKIHISAPRNYITFRRDMTSRGIEIFLAGGNDSKPYSNISIYLNHNIKLAGSYIFGKLDSGQNIQFIYSAEQSGEFYSDSDKNAGELIIESISDEHIKGSFKAECLNQWDSTNVAEITKGSFSGDLTPPQ